MFGEITKYYDGRDATFEIIVIILVTFILGFLFGFLLKKGANKKIIISDNKLEGDDFKIIHGITGKIKKLLNKKDINSFEELSSVEFKELQSILKKSKIKYSKSNLKTWSDQAKLAANSCWGELKEYQDLIIESIKK